MVAGATGVTSVVAYRVWRGAAGDTTSRQTETRSGDTGLPTMETG